jgi:ribosomal protein L37AE/L43A
MDELMLLGEERLCPDCGTETLFLPVDAEAWVCTECDVAVPAPVTAA